MSEEEKEPVPPNSSAGGAPPPMPCPRCGGDLMYHSPEQLEGCGYALPAVPVDDDAGLDGWSVVGEDKFLGGARRADATAAEIVFWREILRLRAELQDTRESVERERRHRARWYAVAQAKHRALITEREALESLRIALVNDAMASDARADDEHERAHTEWRAGWNACVGALRVMAKAARVDGMEAHAAIAEEAADNLANAEVIPMPEGGTISEGTADDN